MARTLHIVKSAGTVHPWDLLAHQAAAAESCSVILIQDAVTARPAVPCRIFALARDVKTRGADTPHPTIDDDGFLQMIWDAETVVVW
jgi:sulfur transfer complex TusBCD TusB component (DsrH family)